MLNETLNKDYQEHILFLYVIPAKEDKMRKKVLTIKMSLEYLPHGKFEQYKKGQPRPKYSTKDKRVPLIQYDKNQESVMKGILPLWKIQMREVLGTHAYMREVPSDGADGLTIQKFKEDCKIHSAVNSCATYGYFSGVIQQDTRKKCEFEADAEENAATPEWRSLRDLLKKVNHEGKPVFKTIAGLRGGAVMAIVCTGNGRDKALTNTVTPTAAWSISNLLLEQDATGESIEAALLAWFSFAHKRVTVEYPEYDQETGKVSLLYKWTANKSAPDLKK